MEIFESINNLELKNFISSLGWKLQKLPRHSFFSPQSEYYSRLFIHEISGEESLKSI
jgi:hypothetical protein